MFLWSTPVIVNFLLLTAGAASLAPIQAQSPAEPVDKYQWLEQVSSDRSLAWVKAENERTAKVLQTDPRFAELAAAALKLLESPDRLATPDLNGNDIFNVWQDAAHVNGILRRTYITDYLTDHPHWQTLLDYDALGRQDNKKWVQHGRSCLYPENGLCMMSLSAGGEDADTLREFNLKTGQFITGGFVLPKSKQSVAWIDKDTLLVARDWGANTMTKSGYPFVVKKWKRGEPLEKAQEVYRGVESDVRVSPEVLDDSQGHQLVLLFRGLNFFENEISVFTADASKRMALPLKVEVGGLVDGQLILTLDQDWTPEGQHKTFVQGSVLSLKLPS